MNLLLATADLPQGVVASRRQWMQRRWTSEPDPPAKGGADSLKRGIWEAAE